MIAVSIERNDEGGIRRLSAMGHAEGYKRGRNIVCAAVTTLVRTAAKLLAERATVAGDASRRGRLAIEVEEQAAHTSDTSPEADAYFRAIADFLEYGVRDLSNEYPRHIQLSTAAKTI